MRPRSTPLFQEPFALLTLGGAVLLGLTAPVLLRPAGLARLAELSGGPKQLAGALLVTGGLLVGGLIALARTNGGWGPWMARLRAHTIARSIAGGAPSARLVAQVALELEREEHGLVSPETLAAFARSLPPGPRSDAEALLLIEGAADLDRLTRTLDQINVDAMGGGALVASVTAGHRRYTPPRLQVALAEARAAVAAAR